MKEIYILRHAKSARFSINIIDASSLLGNARLIKDDHEISLMRKACDISAEAHIEAMKSVKSIDSEQHIESLYCNEFSKRGGRFQAYTPIVIVVSFPEVFKSHKILKLELFL